MIKDEFFKEHIYLDDNGNQEAIEYISKRRNDFYNGIRKNALKYGNNIKAYDEYVNLIAYLIKTLNMPNNAISASVILNKLTKMGLFSDNGKYVRTNDIGKQLIGFLGINVIEGASVCRHMASFQSDVLNKINIMSYPFYCYMTKNINEDGNDYKCNHTINLIENKGSLYGYDAFNSRIYKLVSDRKMIEMFSDKPSIIYYKPYMEMMIDGMCVGNLQSLMTLFDNVKDKPTISIDEYKYILEYVKKAINENNSLFDLFKDSSKKYIKKITNGLNN